MKKLLVAVLLGIFALSFGQAEAQPGKSVTPYLELEVDFWHRIRFLDFYFFDMADSADADPAYTFSSEARPGEDLDCLFEDILAGRYYLEVYARDEGRENILFFGSTVVEVKPAQEAEAEVVMELFEHQKLQPVLKVDLGDQDKEEVSVEISYYHASGKATRYEKGKYIASEKKVIIPCFYVWVWVSSFEFCLPEYGNITGFWEVEWDKWKDVEIFIASQIGLDVKIGFLTDYCSETRKVLVVPIDFPTLAEAMEEAYFGDLIRVRQGSYWAGGLTLKEGVTLEGLGPQSHIYCGVEGIRVQSEVKKAYYTHTLRNLKITHCAGCGSVPTISVLGAPNLKVENCIILSYERGDVAMIAMTNWGSASTAGPSALFENCTFVGQGQERAIRMLDKSKAEIRKSVFLNLGNPFFFEGDFKATWDDQTLFWNCWTYPPVCRIEDPLLDLPYAVPSSPDSPCVKEGIGAVIHQFYIPSLQPFRLE